MASIKVVGDAVVIISEVALEDIKYLKKYSPDSLVLKEKDKDGKETPVFSIGVGNGNISKYGVEFSGATRDEDQLATATFLLRGVEQDADELRERVADEFGITLIRLNELEETLPDAIASAKASREKIMAGISIA